MTITTASLYGQQEINTIGETRSTSLSDGNDHVVCAVTFGARVKVWIRPNTPGQAVAALIQATTDVGAWGQFNNSYELACSASQTQSEALEFYGGSDKGLIIVATRFGANDLTVYVAPTDQYSFGTVKANAFPLLVGTTEALDEDDATEIAVTMPDDQDVDAGDLCIALVGVNDDGTVVPDLPDAEWDWLCDTASASRVYPSASNPCLRACFRVMDALAQGNITAVADLGGSPNEVRCTVSADHGVKAGDFVVVAGTTDYDGTWEVTNVSDSTHFDFEHAFTSTKTGTYRVRFKWKDPAGGGATPQTWGVTMIVLRSEAADENTTYGIGGFGWQLLRNQKEGTTVAGSYPSEIIPSVQTTPTADEDAAFFQGFGNPVAMLIFVGANGSDEGPTGSVPFFFAGSFCGTEHGKGGSISFEGNKMLGIGYGIITDPNVVYKFDCLGEGLTFDYQWATYCLAIFS